MFREDGQYLRKSNLKILLNAKLEANGGQEAKCMARNLG